MLALAGSAFLLVLGLRIFLASPAEQVEIRERRGLLPAYASVFALTLTNPLTILSFVAIFAGLGLAARPACYAAAGLMVLGVFLGSAAWWTLLSGGVGMLRKSMGPGLMRTINHLAGAVIMAFGAAALATAFGVGG